MGSFDGILLLKRIYQVFGVFNLLLDNSRKIIQVKISKYSIKFKDSLRILPESLKTLCEMFKLDKSKINFDPYLVTLKILTENK